MKTRKNIAILMTIILLFATTTTVFAMPYRDIDNSPHRDAIEEMSRLGILQGVGNGLFSPEGELNRAAAAKVAAILLGYTQEDADDAVNRDPMFSDIVGTSHQWALGWINLMAEDGILQGVGNESYAPGNPLQMVHWVTILTRILQHEEVGMSWPDDYNEIALTLDLDDGLDYQGARVMNRAQMAQMTYKAIYEVPRPDGMHIIDLVEFEIVEFEDENPAEEIVYENTKISVKVDKTLVPAGGSQLIQVTATATYGPNNLPAANTLISIMANVDETDRNSQLSSDYGISDANGSVIVTYTTLVADDNKPVTIKAAVSDGNDWVDNGVYIMASNSASLVKGTLLNPFNGTPVEGAAVVLEESNGGKHHFFSDATDSDGSYSIAIQPGSYFINFQMDIKGVNPYDGIYYGSHSDFRNDGTLNLRSQLKLSQGQTHTFNSNRGILTGIANNFPAGTEIYFTPLGTQNTSLTKVADNGRFLLALDPGKYEITAFGGTIYRSSVTVETGKITNIGTITR
ncbi:S-layer homology domain-containing protein [Gudongella sp. SC589]|uniref:S-layer homology domain-containing protein n=1 Tax=Gudongella sp. SC589 TaxID=3385990 RepID=UPI0039046E9A